MARLEIGIVGAGVIGLRHLRRLAVRDDVVVAGVVDPASGQRDQVTALIDVPTFESAEALLASCALEAVIVCVPPDQRGATEGLFLQAGTPMLVEKPIAADLETAERLACHVADSGVPVIVGYQWRQISFLPKVREVLAEQSANLVVATWMCPSATAPWWGDVRSAGGQLIEQATHLIDLAILLNGNLVPVAGLGSAERVGGSASGFHKASSVLVRFENGAVGSFVATCVLAEPYRRTIEILGDNLTVVIGEDHGMCINSAGRHLWPHEGPDLYVREHDAFLELVDRGETRQPIATYAEALAAHRAACAMEAALATTAATIPPPGVTR